MLKWLRPKTVILRPEDMQQVVDILFPPLETREGKDGVYQIDYSIDSNLQSALVDLQDGTNDKIVQDTIAKVIDALIKVRNILEVYPEIDERSKYIIVDMPDQNKKEVEAD